MEREVADFIEKGIEPAAELGGCSLLAREPAVGGVQNKPDRQDEGGCQTCEQCRRTLGDDDRRGENTSGGGDSQGVRTHARGFQGMSDRLGRRRRPKSTEGLIRFPAFQFGFGIVERVGPIERPERGGLRIAAETKRSSQSIRVIEPIGTQHRGVLRGRAGDESVGTLRPIDEQVFKMFVFVRTRVDGDRSIAQVGGEIKQVREDWLISKAPPPKDRPRAGGERRSQGSRDERTLKKTPEIEFKIQDSKNPNIQ